MQMNIQANIKAHTYIKLTVHIKVNEMSFHVLLANDEKFSFVNFHPPVHTQKLRGQTRQGWREAGEVKESEVRVKHKTHKTVSPLGKFLGSAGQREAKHRFKQQDSGGACTGARVMIM